MTEDEETIELIDEDELILVLVLVLITVFVAMAVVTAPDIVVEALGKLGVLTAVDNEVAGTVGAATPNPRLLRVLQLEEEAAGLASGVCASPSTLTQIEK